MLLIFVLLVMLGIVYPAASILIYKVCLRDKRTIKEIWRTL